jgi:hypothetical protein
VTPTNDGAAPVFREEVNVSEAGVEYWLPVQETVNAVNVPLTEIERRFGGIPRQGLVVLY